MKFLAMSDPTFWKDDASANEHTLRKLAGKAADVAGRVVKSARPGRKEDPPDPFQAVALAKAKRPVPSVAVEVPLRPAPKARR